MPNQPIYPSKIREFQNLAKTYHVKYNLGLGDCEIDTPLNIKEATIKAILDGYTHYESNQGNEELRKEIGIWEYTIFKVNYQKEAILVTQGATQAIYLALQATIKKNDEVLVPLPAYPLYRQIISTLKGKYIPITLPKDSTSIKNVLSSHLTPKTKAIIINHPQNPTGKCYTKEEILQIIQFTLQNNLYLIVDECYIALQYNNNPISFTQYQHMSDKLFICRSFSKAWAMSGYRLGYLLSAPKNIELCTYLLQSNISCIPSFIQIAGIEALKTPTLRNHYKLKSELAYNYLSEAYNTNTIEGGLYYFLPTERNSEEFIKDIITKHSIALTPGTAFDQDNYYRISLCASDTNLREALRIIINQLKKTNES